MEKKVQIKTMETGALATLLQIRSNVEKETQALRDALAAKTKVLNSLSETIDLLRGWHPVQTEDLAKTARHSYDAPAIHEALLEWFAEHEESRIEDIGRYLEERELVPSFSDKVRNRIARALSEIPEVKCKGHSTGARWYLVSSKQSANGVETHR